MLHKTSPTKRWPWEYNQALRAMMRKGEKLDPWCQWWCISALDYLPPNFYCREKYTWFCFSHCTFWSMFLAAECNSRYKQPCEPDIKSKQDISKENKNANNYWQKSMSTCYARSSTEYNDVVQEKIVCSICEVWIESWNMRRLSIK